VVTRPNPLKKDQRMDKITRKTSFGQWFSPINLQLFEEQVKTMKLDYYTKKLTTESFLKLLLFTQLEEIESLHALGDCLFDDQLQKGIDLDSISISQLSRRLNGMNSDIFQRLFLDLVAQIHVKTHYTKIFMPLKIIDSSTLPLNLTFKLPDDAAVLSDQMVLIGTTQNRAENFFRLLKVIDSKGNELHLITNRFDLCTEEISEMYKSRWAIELFFKWIKQHLSIKKFYGQSEWAIQNQVFIALIVFCLHVLVQIETKSKRKTLQISRYLRAALWKPAHIWLRKIEGKAIP
jgi:IS4 transposase